MVSTESSVQERQEETDYPMNMRRALRSNALLFVYGAGIMIIFRPLGDIICFVKKMNGRLIGGSKYSDKESCSCDNVWGYII